MADSKEYKDIEDIIGEALDNIQEDKTSIRELINSSLYIIESSEDEILKASMDENIHKHYSNSLKLNEQLIKLAETSFKLVKHKTASLENDDDEDLSVFDFEEEEVLEKSKTDKKK